MTTENYDFWQMVLHSPVAIALAGGLAGSLITLVVAFLRNNHERKMRKEEWERSEITRKEERLYQNKIEAYKLVRTWIDTKTNTVASLTIFLDSLTAISLFAPYHIREAIAEIVVFIHEQKNSVNPLPVEKIENRIIEMQNNLHGLLLDDLDIHN